MKPLLLKRSASGRRGAFISVFTSSGMGALVAGMVSQCLFPRCDLPRSRGARSQHGVRMPSPVFWRTLVAQVPTAAFSRRHNRNAAGELPDLHLTPPRFYTANTLDVHCVNAVLRSVLPSHRHGSHQPQR